MKRKSNAVTIALSSIMAALVCAATILIQIPIPPTKGYINVGDAMIMVSALTFGAIVGGFAGGVGSALADTLTGWAHWAPYTLIVKGVEGLLAGLLGGKKKLWSKIVAWIVGGGMMVLGYFTFGAILYGVAAALVEVPGNIFQMAFSGLVGIPISVIIEKYIRF